jgi:hypothetical protein
MCDIDDGDMSYHYIWRIHRSDWQATDGPLECCKLHLTEGLLISDLLDGQKDF